MSLRGVLSRAALLLALLLAGCMAGGDSVGGCDVEYELITPDGTTFKFSGPGRQPGSATTLVALEGGGLPPVTHVTQDVYDMPGELMLDINVGPRVITITESVWSTDATREGTHRALAAIWDAVRWDRGPGRADPSIFRYTLDGVSRDLYVNYAGAVESQQGRHGRNVLAGIRFVAHDPFWHAVDTEEAVLDWVDTAYSRLFMSRVSGLWDANVPSPATTANGPDGTQVVHAIAVDPNSGDVYVAGDFDNWDWLGAGVGREIVKYDVSAGAWVAIGGASPGLNHTVYTLRFGPSGLLYCGGAFTDAGGIATADKLCTYNPETDLFGSITPVGGSAGTVYDIAFGLDGKLFICGEFANWEGVANATRIAQRTVAGAWGLVGGALNATAYALSILPNGNVVCGGSATNYAGVAGFGYIGEWDGTAWGNMNGGFNASVLDTAVAVEGTLFAGGNFTQTVGGSVLNYAASWNGVVWQDLGGGTNAAVTDLAIAGNGDLWAIGAFTQAGSLVVDCMARWNRFTWAHVDIDVPGTPSALGVYGSDIYIGFSGSGTSAYSGDNLIVNLGDAFTYPIIEIKNAGVLNLLKNETTDQEILFDLTLQDGEILTVDLTFGRKTMTSTWRGNVLSGSLPNSDLGTFKLESSPRAAYGGVAGTNLLLLFISNAAPRESGDNNNQLNFSPSGVYPSITGLSQANTHLGKLYVNIVDDGGGGFYHVDLYKDAAKAAGDLVGHTATYNGVGVKAITADNNSGLAGSVSVTAVVGVDSDIEVWFTLATMFWGSRWWSLDAAIS